MPAELALHHPYDGVVVVWSDDDVAGRLAGGPVGQVVTFRPAVLRDPLPAMPGAVMSDPDRDVLVHCCFLDDLSGGRPTFGDVDALLVAPFLPTVPGTVTYLDQLW